MEFTVNQISALLGGTVEGNGETPINMIGTIEKATSKQLSFLSNPNYEKYLYTTNAGAVLVKKDFQPTQEVKTTMIFVDDPYLAFTALLKEYQKAMNFSKSGIEQPSHLPVEHQNAEDLYFGAYSYIGKNVKLGKNVKIYPQCYIGDGVSIGDNVILYPGVKVYHDCLIGNNCTLHSGVVLGSDGFGFAPQKDGTFDTIPQLGAVKLEDNVSLGANTVIDRATLPGEFTTIGKGTKLDNLIQVGHNAEIGGNTVIAAQSGIAGSSKVGSNCMIGGQVGISGHISIANGTKIAAQSGIASSIKEPGTSLMGTPSLPYTQYLKSYSVFKKLPEILMDLKEMKKKTVS